MKNHFVVGFTLSLFAALLAAAPVAAQAPADIPGKTAGGRPIPPPLSPPNADAFRDLAYGTTSPLQTLDIYVPKNAAGALPLVIFIHGGGWYSGDKRTPMPLPLLADGFAVASIDYRLSGTDKWPAQIYDCKAAIRWLRANAATYHIDPNRFGAWGTSAGGHLVDLIGTTGANHPELDGDQGTPGVSSAVQAVCSESGPSNLFTMYDEGLPGKRDNMEKNGLDKLLGCSTRDNPDKARSASGITYVAAGDPPFLLVHGDQDPAVPFKQSQEMYDALKAAGDDVELYTVKGGGHVPRDAATLKHMIDFFKAKLQKS
jgi:acetyl esterase/lipase